MKQRLIERVRDRRAELDKLIDERRQRIAAQQRHQKEQQQEVCLCPCSLASALTRSRSMHTAEYHTQQ